MAAPTSYDSEAELAAFMLTRLAGVADVLGWSTLADVQEPVNDALLAYGAATIAAATNVQRLRALADRAIWRAAVAALTTAYDFSRPDGTYSRRQMLGGARAMLADAEARAAEYDPDYGNTAIGSRVDQTRDPYQYRPTAGEWG